MIKLDYTIESPEERKVLVEKILAETPQEKLTPLYLESLANYLILCLEKEERKKKQYLTSNRMVTVNKRETTSVDNIIECPIADPDKNALFQPKIEITEKDLEDIPYLRQQKEAIKDWEKLLKKSSGREAFIIKKSLIEMRKDQYIIKSAFRVPLNLIKVSRQNPPPVPLPENVKINPYTHEPSTSGISLMDPKAVSAILCNYSNLKENSYTKFDSDTYYLLEDFDAISTLALASVPPYETIVEAKIDGKTNAEIQQILQNKYNISHTPEYISSLWRNKIPKMIATKAKEQYIIWYYKKFNLLQKKCTRCGQTKPAHTLFFSKNGSSKDGYYSICKCCRNTKKGDNKS